MKKGSSSELLTEKALRPLGGLTTPKE